MYYNKEKNNTQGSRKVADHLSNKKTGSLQKTEIVDNRPETIHQKVNVPSSNTIALLKSSISKKIRKDIPDENQKNSIPTQQKPVIQRLTGFELELNIPFYGNAKSGTTFKPKQPLTTKDEKDIADFLFGGLNYGTSYGKEAGLFDISADHGSFRKKHITLIETLLQKGLVTAPSSWAVMTNLEYRTKALEERDPGSQAKQEEIAGKVQAHAKQSVKDAISNAGVKLAAPVASYYTGMPVSSFNKLVKGDGDAETKANEIKDAIDPYLYYQETTGVLPSEIPAFFNEAAKDIGKLAPEKTSRANVSKTILELSVKMAENVIADGTHSALLKKLGKSNVKSLQGWMTLIAQYFLAYQVEVTSYCYMKDSSDGDKLKQFGGTAKNMVPYLSKTYLIDTLNALPQAARPDVNSGIDKDAWIALFKGFVSESGKSTFKIETKLGLDNYLGQNYYDRDGKNPKKIEHEEIFGSLKPHEWLSDTLQNVKVHHVMTGNSLTLDDEQEKLSPSLTIKGEQAIPLEDRKAMSKQSFGNIKDINQIENIIKKQWKEAVDRRAASTKERAEYDSYWKKADNFFKSFGDKADEIAKLKTMQEDFAKISVNPDEVETEHEKLDEFLNQTLTKMTELVDNAEGITKKLITEYTSVVEDFGDELDAASLEFEQQKIKPSVKREILPSLFKGLCSYFDVYKKINALIEKTNNDMKIKVQQEAKKIPVEKREEEAVKKIDTEYSRVKGLKPSIERIKAFKDLYKEVKKFNEKEKKKV